MMIRDILSAEGMHSSSLNCKIQPTEKVALCASVMHPPSDGICVI
jgi:hypothetical protein